MKKCVLINCFTSSNEMRIEPVREYFNQKGFETIYLGSDFHHTKKEYVQLSSDIRPIHVRKYNKNLSVDRLLSHHEFAAKVHEELKKEKPDIIYVKFPPNSLVKEVFEYKKYNDCKVILDIFDLWPESLPIPQKARNLIKPITNIWRNLRDKYLSVADIIVTECDMYRELLKDKLSVDANTLYLFKKDIDNFSIAPNKEGEINVCYLGGINNLIDLDSVSTVLKTLSKLASVTLHIIGEGENKQQLIQVAEAAECNIEDHGVIYNDVQKQAILCKCDFGINLMKQNVKVALSLKSIEYFRSGLAVINNLPYDTWKIIKVNGAGFNFDGKNLNISINDLCAEYISKIRSNSRKVYEIYFSEETLKRSMECLFAKL